MVKKGMKFFAYMLFFVFALIVFIPKSSLYYFLEQNLKQYDIVISNESLEEKTLSLELQDLDISLKGIESAMIEEVDITILFIYNAIDIKNLRLSSLVESYMPSKIQKLHIDYSLMHPLSVEAVADGAFGNAEMHFSVMDRNLTVVLKPSKEMSLKYRNSLRKFQKTKKGEYLYAKTF